MLNEMDEYLLTRLFTVVAGVEVTYLYSTTRLRHLPCLIRRARACHTVSYSEV